MLGKHANVGKEQEIAIGILVGALSIGFGTYRACRYDGWWQLGSGIMIALFGLAALAVYVGEWRHFRRYGD